MKLRESVDWIRDGQEPGYLFDRRLGAIFGLNATSAVVLEQLAEGADEELLVAALREQCAASELAARDDVAAFLKTLMEKDLVEL